MSRCASCDRIMTEVEMLRTNSNDEFEELCGDCAYIVFLDVEDLFEFREYAFGDLTESPLGQVELDPSLKVNMAD